MICECGIHLISHWLSGNGIVYRCLKCGKVWKVDIDQDKWESIKARIGEYF